MSIWTLPNTYASDAPSLCNLKEHLREKPYADILESQMKSGWNVLPNISACPGAFGTFIPERDFLIRLPLRGSHSL